MSREFRLGGFIVIGLACFAVAAFLIGNRNAMFHSTYRLNTQFENAVGLEEGAAVRVGGIRKGTVKKISLPHKPGEKINISMDLESTTHDVVKQDSTAAIQSEGLLGDKYVEVSFGTETAANVKSGDSIESHPPIEIANLIAKTDKILDSAGGAVENVKSLTANLDMISGKINNGHGTAGALVNDKTVYNQVSAATSALADDAEALKHNFLLRGFFKSRGYEDRGDLTKYEIARLPEVAPAKTFDFDSKQLFEDADKAKLKKPKMLADVGKLLEQEPFGLVAITAVTSMKGDSEKNKLLTEGQALVVRDYLVKNFKFDDTRVKTMGLGKTDEETNHVQIMIYPQGTAVPGAKVQRAAAK